MSAAADYRLAELGTLVTAAQDKADVALGRLNRAYRAAPTDGDEIEAATAGYRRALDEVETAEYAHRTEYTAAKAERIAAEATGIDGKIAAANATARRSIATRAADALRVELSPDRRLG